MNDVENDQTLRLTLEELYSRPDPLVAEFYIRVLLANDQRDTLRRFLAVNEEFRASVVLDVYLIICHVVKHSHGNQKVYLVETW